MVGRFSVERNATFRLLLEESDHYRFYESCSLSLFTFNSFLPSQILNFEICQFVPILNSEQNNVRKVINNYEHTKFTTRFEHYNPRCDYTSMENLNQKVTNFPKFTPYAPSPFFILFLDRSRDRIRSNDAYQFPNPRPKSWTNA
jgi:hypothetical protein